MPPFVVQYLCPRQSPYWQGNKRVATFQQAVGWAQAMRPNGPLGKARVVDARGVVVFQV
jgi:hypothetical protein